MLGKGYGGLYKAPTKEEEGERIRKRGIDKIKFIEFKFDCTIPKKFPSNAKYIRKMMVWYQKFGKRSLVTFPDAGNCY